jgi:hypothetical protein
MSLFLSSIGRMVALGLTSARIEVARENKISLTPDMVSGSATACLVDPFARLKKSL